MGKKQCWFTYVKKLFISDSKPKSKESSKKWRWFFDKFMLRKRPAALEAAPLRKLSEAAEVQRKHALAVAMATAAAAEAAVAAANAAAEVVRLTNIPYEVERKSQYFAALKIQSTYRGHLARKALSALKGLVKIQAVIRGELVRRRVVKSLPSVFLFTKSQPQARQSRVPTLMDYLNQGEKRCSLKEGIKSEELKVERSWDVSLTSKEDMEALYLQKQEAIAKRERIKQYSFSHRERRNDHSLQELIFHKENRKSRRFDQYIQLDTHHQHEEHEKPKPFSEYSNIISVDHARRLAQLKLKTACQHENTDQLSSPFSLPRRSFCHVKQKSIGDDRSLPNSPVFPTYMAATKSAKAKCRSLSTPRQRLRLCETYSGDHSPYKLGLSSWSSFNGRMTKSGKRNSISQQTLWNG